MKFQVIYETLRPWLLSQDPGHDSYIPLSQKKPFHSLFNFSVIAPSTLRSSEYSPPFTVYNKNSMHVLKPIKCNKSNVRIQ
jgi:hypothetical protein